MESNVIIMQLKSLKLPGMAEAAGGADGNPIRQ
jgi:hypothetical protein